MASNNRLLTKSGLEGAVEVVEYKPLVEESTGKYSPPAWRFHKDCLEGKIGYTVQELKDLDRAGWVDTLREAKVQAEADKRSNIELSEFNIEELNKLIEEF
jgi:hypothetical protein